MKKMLYVSLCLLASSLVFGAECSKYNRAYVSAAEHGVPYLLRNKSAQYVVSYRYQHPSPSRPSQVVLGMVRPLPRTGFGPREFSFLTINGIDSQMLEPKKFEIFNTKESSGIDVHYNFDGIPMIQRFSISDSSPLLTMTWLRGKGKPMGPIKTMSIRINAIPCAAGKAPGSYSREVVSSLKVYSPRGRKLNRQKLSAQDGNLIFQDAKYQSGKGRPFAGPVLLCPDWKSILSGTAVFGAQQEMHVIFKLDPKAASWSFGMLESEIKHSNAEFADFVKSQGIIP